MQFPHNWQPNSPHTVDVRLVGFEGLDALARAHVPHVGLLIAALRGTHAVRLQRLGYGALQTADGTAGTAGVLLTPETNVLPVSEGARSRHSTSAACPWKLCSSCPLSTSHRAHVPSPLDVRIFHANSEEAEKRSD